MKIIEITVSPTGQTKIETKGFQGVSCRQASEALERALGVKVSDQPTSEFYTAQTQDERIQEGL
jgi:hypothetical protein